MGGNHDEEALACRPLDCARWWNRSPDYLSSRLGADCRVSSPLNFYSRPFCADHHFAKHRPTVRFIRVPSSEVAWCARAARDANFGLDLATVSGLFLRIACCDAARQKLDFGGLHFAWRAGRPGLRTRLRRKLRQPKCPRCFRLELASDMRTAAAACLIEPVRLGEAAVSNVPRLAAKMLGLPR
jgi:hypothetical protein